MSEGHSDNTRFNNHKSRDELFFQLFMTYQRNFYAFILSSVHNYADANDLLQETATVMWRKFDEFQQGTSFLAWGITIAHNLVLKFFNEHKRSRIQFDDALLKDLADTTMNEIKNVNTLTEALRHCFQKLNETNQKLLRLRYQEGMTIKAIASMLGKPVFGMYKAFARLQDALQVCIENTLRREGAVE
ncbi:MAG TPA: sigma-70 family RNA polymerase sigma factor [Anaerohalosphaeraceae bacterium]|nr:sigma-70 family RNA polymerase sigma factor [Anaerohalosphaeraceae bacterium]HOL89044.1 sigma-70 family RNA polymerase sigma factor [Anaerohalosphaeraceae bacterium]HPP56922.1 sigma-70 family RNA polymerase sigma factor [Anaerohalosphaeraceae bacterium]